MKKQRFLFTLLMAIVMMAFSPQRVWAQEEDGGDPGNEECSHDWVSDNVAQEPSCDTSGQYESYRCNICGATVGGEPIPALGHLFGLESDNEGNHYWKCSRCDEQKETEPCSFVNGKCTKCKYECIHDEWDNSRCTICGMVCSNHEFDYLGNCNTCDATTDIVSVTIGGIATNYRSFSAALTVALNTDAATITLLQNFTINASITISKGNVTLDLNGHTISNTGYGYGALELSGGSLTIMDSGNTGEINTTVGNAVYATGGTITIHGGTFKTNSGSAFYVDNSGVNVSIDGGQFVGNMAIILGGKSALAFGYSYYISGTDTELTDVTNGPVSTSNGIVPDVTVKPATVKGTLTIGGETTNYYHFNTAFSEALDAASATIKMLKDVDLLNGQAPYSLDMDRGNLTLDLNGHTINKPRGGNVLNQSGGELTIIDSSVGKTGTMQTVGSSALNVTGGAITIHGGTFKAGSGIAFYVDNSTVNVSIDGGQFVGSSAIYLGGKSALAFGYSYYISGTDTELSDVTSGFVMTSNGDAKDITVKPATVKATLTIGGETTNYYDFKIAFGKALDAESAVTMKILKDVNVFSVNGSKSNPLEFNKGNVTIDLNGHRIYQSNSGPVMNMSAGSLTIIDSSEDKTGKMDTDAGYIFGVSGGSLTVRGGTFTTGSVALFVDDNADVTVSLEGGRFQSGVYTAIRNLSSKSILADGFAFYNALTGIKLYASSGEMKDEDGNFAHDVIVECDHDWNDGTCSKCGKVCKHSFNMWGECTICGFVCTHEGSKPNADDPASGHDCPVCQNTYEHNCIDGVCTECGYECKQHKWSNETGRCNICGIECAHQFDANDHCTVCRVTCTVSATIGGESKKYSYINAAIDAAENAGEPATITLLQDVVDDMTISDGDDITLDLNGHTFAGDYTTVINVYGGSLTITDNSAEKIGKVVHPFGIIGAYGGSLTIHAGTFESYGYSALHIESDADYAPLTVSIDGGRFITNGETSAIYSEYGANILAPGYGFYNTDTDARLTNFVDHQLMDENGNPARDVTVKANPVLASVTTSSDAVEYYDFKEAMDAACNAGEAATVTLLHDVANISTYYNFARGIVTLDLNSHSLGFHNGYGSLTITGGNLTITDNSDDKLGQITDVFDYTINHINGSLTIHAGTFYATYKTLIVGEGKVTIDGGRFVSKENSSTIGVRDLSVLAPGYGFFNTATGARLTNIDNHDLMDENGNPAKDVTVKVIPVLASVTTSSGTVEYTDLVEAKDAASNAGEPATITLLHDAKTDVNSTVTFCSGNVTLDLNGYTITSEYSSVIDVAGGSLTITDSSAGKTGKMVNAETAIYAYGGTINIQGGTFTSNNHTALYCISSEFSREPLAVSIEGGRFITKNENMSAIYSEVGSLLAPGYGFYNTDNDARLTNFVDHQLMNENGNPAKNVTVKPLVIDALDLADATPYDGMNAGCTVTDFTYTRNFGGTNWTTWYAPFDLELTDEICQKLAFSRINNVHQYDDDDNGVPDRTIIESFRQKAGVTLRANYPYLVKALNDADRNIVLHLSNVTLAPAAENSIDCNSVDYIYTFTGTYTGKSNNSDAFGAPYSLFDDVADNNWYHFHNLEPQRHYMVIEPTNGGQTPRNIKVNLKVAGEEDATGIVTLYSDKEKMQDEVEVYDLMGRKLNSNSTQRGLRIQNGKVIFNK